MPRVSLKTRIYRLAGSFGSGSIVFGPLRTEYKFVFLQLLLLVTPNIRVDLETIKTSDKLSLDYMRFARQNALEMPQSW